MANKTEKGKDEQQKPGEQDGTDDVTIDTESGVEGMDDIFADDAHGDDGLTADEAVMAESTDVVANTDATAQAAEDSDEARPASLEDTGVGNQRQGAQQQQQQQPETAAGDPDLWAQDAPVPGERDGYVPIDVVHKIRRDRARESDRLAALQSQNQQLMTALRVGGQLGPDGQVADPNAGRYPTPVYQQPQQVQQQQPQQPVQQTQEQAPLAPIVLPDQLDDPEGYSRGLQQMMDRSVQQQFQQHQPQQPQYDPVQQQTANRAQMSEMILSREKPDYFQVREIFNQAATRDPLLAQQALDSNDPASFVYNYGQRQMLVTELGVPADDPRFVQAVEERAIARYQKQLAGGQQPQGQRQGQQQQPQGQQQHPQFQGQITIPGSIGDVSGEGYQAAGQVDQGEESLDSIFKH